MSSSMGMNPKKFAPIYATLDAELERILHSPVSHRTSPVDIEVDVARARDVHHIVHIVFTLIEQERTAFAHSVQLMRDSARKREKSLQTEVDRGDRASEDSRVQLGATFFTALCRILVHERPLRHGLAKWVRAVAALKLAEAEERARLSQEASAFNRQELFTAQASLTPFNPNAAQASVEELSDSLADLRLKLARTNDRDAQRESCTLFKLIHKKKSCWSVPEVSLSCWSVPEVSLLCWSVPEVSLSCWSVLSDLHRCRRASGRRPPPRFTAATRRRTLRCGRARRLARGARRPRRDVGR